MAGVATTILIDDTPTGGSDPWVDSLVSGGAWTDGNGGTVTIQWTSFQGTMDGQNSYAWTPAALGALREAMALWESVANIDFVEVSGTANADVKFWWGTQAQAGGSDVLGWSDLPGYSESEVLDVLFNAQDPALTGALSKGGLGLVTMVHEIGHLLGLAHPHDGGAGWEGTTFPGVDWLDTYSYGDGGLNQGVYTTMSYNYGWPERLPGHWAETWGLQAGPMALDIAAIQSIYGANTNYASGDNVYYLPRTSSVGTYWSTIWDTGGIDTISNATSIYESTIDLRPATEGAGGGNVSYVSLGSGSIISGGYTIARGVVIENAIGGTNNDKLIGNAANNRLEGGQGDDTLDGGAGIDTMIGGFGEDTYYVDDARDVVVESDFYLQVDTVYSTAANYTLRANVENLILMGSAAINGKGNSAANTIHGNAGNNTLEGGGGGDHLYGEYGDDRLIVNDRAFARVEGGEGIDTLVLGDAGIGLDLSLPTVALKIGTIERIDLTGTGDNTLTVSRASLVEGISQSVDGEYILVVEGNAGDRLWFSEEGWTKSGSFTDASGTFDRWEFGYTIVHVEQGVSVEQKPEAASFLLSTLDGNNGFKLAGGPTDQRLGLSVASAGDVNGDGFDDVIVGSVLADAGATDTGASYVVFGKASGFAASIALSTLNGSNGFKLSGAAAKDHSGVSVASAGDVNGDGFADLIVGATGADPHGDYSGATYVVFGKASGFAANLNLSALNGSNGFKLSGTATRDFSGASVASAGDFNNDGYDDLIIGAYGAKPSGSTEEVGAVYIVYGKALGFAANIDLSALNANTGLKLLGVADDEMTGDAVASAGDVNGDGYDDVIVGVKFADGWAGASYVVFGRASGTLSSLDLGALNGTNGFRLSGIEALDESGYSVASAGDVNGDGFADLIVGAYRTNANGEYSGASYVVFGKASGFAADFNLATLNGTNGFRLEGVTEGDRSGVSVASAGDVNGDGFADLIVGARQSDVSGFESGASYVVFGKASGFAANIDLANLDGTIGFRIAGVDDSDWAGGSVASAGDVNGDGYDDLIVGAPYANTSGASYVVFGGAFGNPDTPVMTTGTAAAEILMGGRGNDVLRGGGGGDVFHAGAGNDRLTVKDLAFRLVDGGTGLDTLALGGAGLSLDLSNPLVATRIEGIERIDLSGLGDNTLIVDQLGVLGGIGAVAGGKHVLVVEGNIGDQVQFKESNWTRTGSFTNADGTFDRWVLGNAEVHVEQFSLVPAIGATIAGTAGNDVISTLVTVPGQPTATDLADIIEGGGGNDVLDGGDGNDALYGGSGDDTLIGGAAAAGGTNQLWGGTDNDTASYAGTTGAVHAELAAQAGYVGGVLVDQMNSIENLTGGSGNDVLVGDDGNNVLSGGAGNDVLYGQGGDDILIGGAAAAGGTNQLWGGAGSDTASYAGATGAVHADLAAQVAYVDGVLVDQMDSIENLTGGSGNDMLVGNAGANVLAGRAGNDSYWIGSGDTIVEAAGEGIDTVNTSVDYTLGANLESLLLTGAANLNGTGNELANTLTGNAGDNRLDGGGGADTMTGGLGNDTYVVDNAGDVVTEVAGAGIDTVLSSITYTLQANVENLTLTGADAINGTGNGLDNWLTGNAAANTLSGGLGNDTYVVDSTGDAIVETAGGGTDTVRASIDYTLGANLENLVLTGTANLSGTGNGLANVLTGNAGNNLLDGGAGADTMTGGLGDDTYVVGASDVVIEEAGGGVDTVRSSISYTLTANVEKLVLTGSATINGTGNALANVLTGNDGINVLDGGAGADTMAGGMGNDTYVVDDAGDVVVEAADEGVDTVRASISHTLAVNVEKLMLQGTAHLNGTGNELANTLTGNAGNNVLDGGLGADTMIGGGGNDTYVVDNAGDVLSEALDGGLDTVQASVSYRLRANIENLTLTGGANIDGTGNELANVLLGNAGNNILDGGLGADTMTGGLGDDTYVLDVSGDKITELAGQGIDTVQTTFTHVLRANFENLTLLGTADISAVGNTVANVLTGNVASNVLDGGAGADTMAGGRGNDSYVVENGDDLVIERVGEGTDSVRAWIDYALTANVEKLVLQGTADLNGTGNELANALVGNAGNNRLDGGLGGDTMTGGAGDDTYIIDNAADRASENADGGFDTLLSSITYMLRANAEKLVLTGTDNINAVGNTQDNVLSGNAGNNILDGGAGADEMAGGDGNDTYVVENAGDVVTELADGGSDSVRASLTYSLSVNVEKLLLYGTANIDGTGNDLANSLVGNSGRNILDGGLGADTLTGSGGGDTFRFSTALGAGNVDRITAFDHTADTIQLDDAIFASLGLGALAIGAFNTGTVATQADDRILFDAASKSLYYDADGAGGAAAVKFATFVTLTGALDHTDFFVV